MTIGQRGPDALASGPRAGRREWIGLVVLALPLLLVSMDVSVLYFAVPFISRDLGADATQQLWIFDIYGFVLAGLLTTMGSLGDRIGRRRLLMTGAVAFGAASVAAAYARNPSELIAARALLGIGGATLMPSTLALIRNMFHDPDQRAKAIGFWSAVLIGGGSLGPIAGGFLLEHFWWGSVFLMNTPAMVLLIVLAPRLLPEFKSAAATRFDLVSSGLSLGAVLPVIYGIKRFAAHGIGWSVAVFVAVGVVLGAAFIRRQRTVPSPMIDLAMFHSRVFSGAVVANTVAMFAMVGSAIFFTQYLQLVRGMSPLTAALWSVAPSVLIGVAAPLATVLGERFGKAHVLSGGFVVGAVGFAVIARVSAHSGLAVALIGAALLSAGLVSVMTVGATVIMGAVAPVRAGSAAAVMETGSELGGALGIAVLGSLGAAVYSSDLADRLRASLTPGAVHTARQSLAAAGGVAARLPSRQGTPVLELARQAFTHGLSVVAITGTALLVAAAALCAILLRRTDDAAPEHHEAWADEGRPAELTAFRADHSASAAAGPKTD